MGEETHRKKLYHYTSKESGRKILERGVLRFSRYDKVREDVRGKRDEAEFQLGAELLKTSFDRYFEEYKNQLCFQEISEMPMHNVKNRNHFIGCFCERNDNEYLWEHYAENGSGYCLEFDEVALENLAIHWYGLGKRENDVICFIKEVVYGENNFINMLSHSWNGLVFPNFKRDLDLRSPTKRNMIRHLKKQLKMPDYLNLRDQYTRSMIDSFLLKRGAEDGMNFSSEEEIRMVIVKPKFQCDFEDYEEFEFIHMEQSALTGIFIKDQNNKIRHSREGGNP